MAGGQVVYMHLANPPFSAWVLLYPFLINSLRGRSGCLLTAVWLSGAYDNLLAKALSANTIVLGEDTKYWKPGQPTVVRLVGDPSSLRGLVVIESDYEQLRENEGDRRLLLSFIREELAGKVVLFLGYDPASPDFALLVQYILNGHLLGTDVRAFLAWPRTGPEHAWGEHPIHRLRQEPLELVEFLAQPG